MKRLEVIHAWTNSGFAEKMRRVFTHPDIEIIRVTYQNSWGVHYAYIEYEEKATHNKEE
jgi:hypothetical protein